MGKIRVLVVDDSALMRQLLTAILSADPGIEVVGTAPDGISAHRKVIDLAPDVLTLDVEMPRQDGLAFLQQLMRERPMPVVMVSSLTERGCATTLRALELGAVDFVTKPAVDVQTGTVALGDEIAAKVKAAARARLRFGRGRTAGDPSPVAPSPVVVPGALLKTTQVVIAIGASTGGTEALRELLSALPADAPGIVVVQHMPERFTQAFAERLNGCCHIRVAEARDGDSVLPGHALIAPGNYHMRLTRSGAAYKVQVLSGEAVNRHRPSVDVLFESCARVVGRNAVGVIMTGMGNDGARGMRLMHEAGARTIAQDEASCVVFGMPKEAIAAGGVDEIVPLPRIAGAMLRLASL